MDSQLLKKMDSELLSFKKARDYIVNVLDEDIKKNGFLTLDENAYNRNVKEFAIKKSEITVLFGNTDNFEQWLQNTSIQNKNYLYDIVKNNQLEITQKDLNILAKKETIIPHGYTINNPSYIINPSYNDTLLKSVNTKVISTLLEQGEKHLDIQGRAKKTIEDSITNPSTYQKTMKIFHDKFGDKYDDILSEFKVMTKNREVEESDGAFIISSKHLGMNQKIKISINDLNQIHELSTVPPNIKVINDKFRTNNNENTSKLKIN